MGAMIDAVISAPPGRMPAAGGSQATHAPDLVRVPAEEVEGDDAARADTDDRCVSPLERSQHGGGVVGVLVGAAAGPVVAAGAAGAPTVVGDDLVAGSSEALGLRCQHGGVLGPAMDHQQGRSGAAPLEVQGRAVGGDRGAVVVVVVGMGAPVSSSVQARVIVVSAARAVARARRGEVMVAPSARPGRYVATVELIPALFVRVRLKQNGSTKATPHSRLRLIRSADPGR